MSMLHLELILYLFLLSPLSKPQYHIETGKLSQFLFLQNIFLSIN